jgi:hypothetical protein
MIGAPHVRAGQIPQGLRTLCRQPRRNNAEYLLRNSFRYASRRDWDAIARALKPVYTAPSEAAARPRLSSRAA